jgi:hypothetical protein
VRPTSRRLALAASAGVLSLLATRPAAAASDVRAIDSNGRVLTVGSFSMVRSDGGLNVRVENTGLLSWELHDQDRIVGSGVVPGSDALGEDSSPALSRNPMTGDLWLAWSRQYLPGQFREIAIERFTPAGPDETSLRILASGNGDQLSPAILHDEKGFAYVAFVDASADRQIKVVGLNPDGIVLDARDLSAGRSGSNSAPQIGIDASGQIFVAFLGTDATTAATQLYVLAPSALPGGVTHVPNPLGQLGLEATLPAPQATTVPAVQLTVLGGTPIAWWSETSAANHLLFRYVAQGASGWSTSRVDTIDLSTGLIGSVPEALTLLEARLRRVVAAAPSTTLPAPPSLQPIVVRPGGMVIGRR